MSENTSELPQQLTPSLTVYREVEGITQDHIARLTSAADTVLAERGLSRVVQDGRVKLEIGKAWRLLAPLVPPASIKQFFGRNNLPMTEEAMYELEDYLADELPRSVDKPIVADMFPAVVYKPSAQSRWVNLGVNERSLAEVGLVQGVIARRYPNAQVEGIWPEVPETASARIARVSVRSKRWEEALESVTSAVVDATTQLQRLDREKPEAIIFRPLGLEEPEAVTYHPLDIEQTGL